MVHHKALWSRLFSWFSGYRRELPQHITVLHRPRPRLLRHLRPLHHRKRIRRWRGRPILIRDRNHRLVNNNIVQVVPCPGRPGLGWLWFQCSTILPSCPAASAKFPSAQAQSGRQWNTRNPSQQNPVYEHMGRPVFEFHSSLNENFLSVSVMSIGQIMGALLAGASGSALGRRYARERPSKIPYPKLRAWHFTIALLAKLWVKMSSVWWFWSVLYLGQGSQCSPQPCPASPDG